MRITFVLPVAGLAGGIRVVAIYAERLRRRGHEVLVVSQPRPRRGLGHRLRRWVKTGQWAPSGPPPGSHMDGVDVPHHVLERNRPITDADVPDADVIVATWWETAEWIWRLPPSKGAKAYFIQHYEAHADEARDGVDRTWRLPMHKITIANWLARKAREEFGDEAVDLVHNSVDTDQFHAPPRGKQPVPTVGILYRNIHWKGCDVSLDALRRVRDALGEVRLVAFGAHPVSADLPLPDDAVFHLRPPQDRIRDIYAQCDAWVWGSRTEGFGLPPLEAMACRCPVVSTRCGGPEDYVRHGESGFLVDVDDAAGLAEHLERVLRLDDASWRAMSDAAHRAATGYTWDDATDLFAAALERAIERTRSGELVPQAGA